MTDVLDQTHEWWQRGIVYQIYPRSFQDSDGDGVGDLPGIITRLDYLQWLGIDALWLSPIFPSPMADFGYDVSDYCAIHPMFGTMADFDRLVEEAHRRDLRVILDFVPNHTSDEHPWFAESRASRGNPKRDWFLWRDPAPGGGPPNNWLSNFGGPAWTRDDRTDQYYYHAFLSKQPDLNWRNPEVRRAMHDVLRFWLERGVDGFRIDVIYHIVKDEQFRDNPRNPAYRPGEPPHHEFLSTYNTDLPEVHDLIAEMRQVVDEYPGERMLVGEVYLPVERMMAYYGQGGNGVHMPFNFQLITLPWNARSIAEAIDHYEEWLPPYGWPNWVLGNHDKPRVASRVGAAQARVAAMLLLTLRGTPTMYYGDEIGMTDVPIPPERVQDPFEKNVPGLGLGRDPQRTPMQWDGTAGAGFTTGQPWLPLPADFSESNIAAQREDARSILSLYRRLIDLRRAESALSVGGYEAVELGHAAEPEARGDLIAYIRRDQRTGRHFLVVLNLGSQPGSFHPAEHSVSSMGRIRLSTHLDREGEPVQGAFRLRADEGVVVELA